MALNGFKDYFRILGISRNATDKEIKSAFRNLKEFILITFFDEQCWVRIENLMTVINLFQIDRKTFMNNISITSIKDEKNSYIQKISYWGVIQNWNFYFFNVLSENKCFWLEIKIICILNIY